MANLNIKPASGGKLKLQRHTGADALTVDTHGNVQVSGTITTGTLTNAVAVPQEVIKKFHHFTFSTRTGGNGGITNQFTYSGTFTPLDPYNNTFHVHGAVPVLGQGQDFCGYGLRFEMSAANAAAQGYAGGHIHVQFCGRGVIYADMPTAYHQTFQSYNFIIGPGELPAGPWAIQHYTESDSSQANYYNPNSSDDARTATQSQSELMIIEFANI